jgi:hypothetical protein
MHAGAGGLMLETETMPDEEREDEREETLGEFLAARARNASEIRLVGDAAFSVFAAVAVGVWRGPLWDVRIAIALCFLAFGIWGVADRDLARRPEASRREVMVPRVTRIAAAILGFGAAAYLMMSLLGRAIGRVIS